MSSEEHENRMRRHFDRRAAGYAGVFSRGPLGILRWIERRPIFELLEPRTGGAILDAGCGVGLDAKRLGNLGCLVDGIDLSPEMVERARQSGISAEVGDLQQLELGRRYDKILCAGPLEFCADPERVIERLALHLEPGGRLVILFPTSARGGRLYRFYYRTRGVEARLFEIEEMIAIVKNAGLVVRAIRQPLSFSAVIAADKPR